MGVGSIGGYVPLFPDCAEPETILMRRFQERLNSADSGGSSWIWRSRKAVSQRRSSPTGKLSPAEDALKRRMT
jgi:hypothetical protein